jgi:hypothetical protein
MNKKLSGFAAVVVLAACGTPVHSPSTQMQDPSRYSYTRIYCTPDNESHFEAVTTDLAKVDAAPPAPPMYAKGSSATRLAFAAFEPGWGSQDEKAKKYHPAPAPQYVIYLQGQMSVTTSDGESRQFGAGDVLRVEDVAPCKGHFSVVGASPAYAAVVR